MKANAVTYIGFVQDHSGSMSSNKELAVSNFNEQRATLLKEDDDTMDNLVTIIEFDDQIHCNVENMPINEVKEMDHWWTGGMTKLFDSIIYCINNIKEKMNLDIRKDKAVLIIIQTDGYENASSDYIGEEGRKKIKSIINELENTNKWTFVFLGENIDKKTAMDIGFDFNNIMSHKSSETKYAYAATTNGLDRYLKMRKQGKTQTKCFYNDNSK